MTTALRCRRAGAVAALVLAVVLSGACSGGSDSAQARLPALQSRHESGARAYPYENLSELLDNKLYKVGNEPAAPLTAAVVTGRFLDLAPGRAFTVEGNDSPGGAQVAFDSPAALWRTMHARFAVDELISGNGPGNEITVGLSFDSETSLEPVKEDLLGLGPVALFLQRTPVFGYDAQIYGVVLDGGLIAPIDSAGRLTLPVLEPIEAAKLLKGSGTLRELKVKAREPQQTIELDATGTEKLPD